MVVVPVSDEQARKAVETADQLLVAIQSLAKEIGARSGAASHIAPQHGAVIANLALALDAVTRLLEAYKDLPTQGGGLRISMGNQPGEPSATRTTGAEGAGPDKPA